MIRTLRRRFIRSSMLAVTLVMALFLAALTVANYWAADREARQTLQLIMADDAYAAPAQPGTEDPGAAAPGTDPPGGTDVPSASSAEMPLSDSGISAAPAGNQTDGGSAADALTSERYFFVRLGRDGTVIGQDLTHISQMTEEAAADLAAAARKEDASEGTVGGYRYLRYDDRVSGGTYAFLDESGQNRTLFRTTVLTLLIGAASWVLVLFLVMDLSRRAIQPIAESIQRQKQFVTDAGHEIKTPLAIIRANADVLELHAGKSRWLDNIRAQTDRLASLTRNLLTLSKMEEGFRDLPAERFDAGAVAKEILRPFLEPAGVRRIAVGADLPGGLMITAPRDAFDRLLSIFLENAVKYARSGGWIRVRMEAVKPSAAGRQGLLIEIANDTDRMPEGDPMRLFDRFYRADASRSSRTGGSGIGLSVARAIAEGLGGSVSARFEADQTVVFSIRL